MRCKQAALGSLVLTLVACSGHLLTLPSETSPDAGKLLIYREPAYNSSMGSLFFGENEVRYVELRNKEFSELPIVPGKHHFFVTANASQNFEFDVDVAPHSTTCIKSYADPSNYLKILMPILMNLTNIFRAEVVACPNKAFLSEYRKVG